LSTFLSVDEMNGTTLAFGATFKQLFNEMLIGGFSGTGVPSSGDECCHK
jgi:hypothetical protein